MTVNRRTLTELLAQQKALDKIQDDQQRTLAGRWVQTWDRLESELRTRTLEIAQLGDDVGVDAIVRHIKASRALSDVTGHLTALLSTSQALSIAGAQAMIARAASDQQALIATQLPPGWTLNLLRHDPGQLDAIVKRTLDQITVRHYYLNARATESMKQAIVNAVAIGDNPRVAADRMVKAVQGEFEGGLARATVIARTEQLDAYRSAAMLEQNRHPDVMAGWQWCASLSPRTCPSCLNMHGTIHDADEPGPIDHHQGRCARVPVTKTWEQLGFHGIPEPPGAIKPGDGVRWLEQQSGDVQSRILGPKRLDAWKSGHYPPEDWSVRIKHRSKDENGRMRQDWRDSIHVGPVRTPGQKGLPPVEPTTFQPPAPSGPLDRLPRLAAPETGVESLTRTNPNFRKSPDYQNNCPNCALSWELRQRGYDVEAEPLANGRPTRESLKNWSLDYMSEEARYLPGTGKAHINKLAKTLPDGARGMIRCNWKRTYGGGGHIWVWEKQDGKIVLRDPQSGETNVARYLGAAQTGSIRMWRTDDKDFTADSLKGWVKARKDK